MFQSAGLCSSSVCAMLGVYLRILTTRPSFFPMIWSSHEVVKDQEDETLRRQAYFPIDNTPLGLWNTFLLIYYTKYTTKLEGRR